METSASYEARSAPSSYSTIRNLSVALTKALVLGLGVGLFAHMLYGLTDAVVLGAKQGILFWMLLGLINGLFAQVRNGKWLMVDR